MEKQFECIGCEEILSLKEGDYEEDYYLYNEDDDEIGPLCQDCKKVLLHDFPDTYTEDPKYTEW
jgi:hypothetical protein